MVASLADEARRLNLAAGAGRRLPPLILMTDAERLADPAEAVQALPRGNAVILRHYGDPGRAALARALARLCRFRGLIFLVASDPLLAAAVQADGLHLPEHLVGRLGWRRRRPGWLITAAAHSAAGLRAAAEAGVDAAILAPVFASPSRPGRALGPLRFAALAGASALPVYALGGVTAPEVRRLVGSGAAGVAGVRGFAPGGE
jgi:thiamine-phosphate pyrophosphorylase